MLGGSAGDGCKQMGRENKIERTMQLIVREVGRRLMHGLDRFGQQKNIAAMGINAFTQPLQKGMGFRQPLAA